MLTYIQGKMDTSSNSSTASFVTGLATLFVAQLLSAIMGLYVQATYAKYGPYWNENLFYSHFLSLPLFLPFFPVIWKQFVHLFESRPVTIQIPNFAASEIVSPLELWRSSLKQEDFYQFQIPIQVINLAVNALTQYACIRGVNLLAARTSALGVSIVLNLRKLVSLFISIWLFGNNLPLGVATGAMIVFAGAGVYAWSGQRGDPSSGKSKKG
jgi:solute carrier family 35 (UDP-xylose/UDP-N-acetylglucosamine transporter), member B4